jgi:hypothetical protein
VVRVPGVNTRDCMVWLDTGKYSSDIAGCSGGLWNVAAVVCWSHAAFLWRCAPDVTTYLISCIFSPIVMLILCLFSVALWAAQVTASGNVVMNSELQRLWKEADVPEFTQFPLQWVPAVKRPGRGVNHPPHLASRLKKE